MNNHIHLLGGTGKIGTNLYQSIHKNKIDSFDTLWVYCDGDKASNLKDLLSKDKNETSIFFTHYSNFSIERLSNKNYLDKHSKNIIINLRGINNKRDWLNKPLEALDIQLQSCLNIIESDINIYPNTSIIHLSSQLCDLIENKNSLKEICEGEDSYRQAYMISRLHQETILKAYAYKFGIETKFIRLPAIYGFEDDKKSPWILNTLIKQLIRTGEITIRKPNSVIWLTHKDLLSSFLRKNISYFSEENLSSNVSYLECPKIGLKLKTLSNLIESSITEKFSINNLDLKNQINLSGINSDKELTLHIKCLKESILNLYKNAKS